MTNLLIQPGQQGSQLGSQLLNTILHYNQFTCESHSKLIIIVDDTVLSDSTL